ncbi:hypothetical protein [Coxiella endosymbiont of Ornithodoros amblus]|nr:hypothetical protein [Coxiella endosymbiont of Ornithodoros amblus]
MGYDYAVVSGLGAVDVSSPGDGVGLGVQHCIELCETSQSAQPNI